MKISFIDFWPNFEKNNNFFLYLLKEIFPKIKVVKPIFADVIFFSDFGELNEKEIYRNKKKVYYTGENLRPNFNKTDYSLSFDFESYENRNFRFPLWMMHIDWFGKTTYSNPNWLIPPEFLNSGNPFFFKDKEKLCSIVYSTQTEERLKFISNVSKIEKVDVYGKVPGAHFLEEGEYEKISTLATYKFSLAMDNSIYPGYHTEKFLQARVSGGIPLYYGAETVSQDFNPEGYLDITNKDEDEVIDIINKIISNKSKYSSIVNSPFFNHEVNLDSVSSFIYKALK